MGIQSWISNPTKLLEIGRWSFSFFNSLPNITEKWPYIHTQKYDKWIIQYTQEIRFEFKYIFDRIQNCGFNPFPQSGYSPLPTAPEYMRIWNPQPELSWISNERQWIKWFFEKLVLIQKLLEVDFWKIEQAVQRFPIYVTLLSDTSNSDRRCGDDNFYWMNWRQNLGSKLEPSLERFQK